MNIKAVIDASIISALYIPEKYSDWAKKIIETYEESHILDLTIYELLNVIYKKALVLKEINEEEAKIVFESIKKFIKELCIIHKYDEVYEKAFEISMKFNISIYDAAYIALALNMKTNFLTMDLKLKEKIKKTNLKEIIVTPIMKNDVK
ncbi:MAG: type II toxin-antitoxin system VapC family toxin [Nitrososphaerota archaeon]